MPTRCLKRIGVRCRHTQSLVAATMFLLLSKTFPLPQHVQFVWQRVDSRAKLERFMQADIHWAEVPIYRDPYTQQLAVNVGESDLTLDAVLAAFIRPNAASISSCTTQVCTSIRFLNFVTNMLLPTTICGSVAISAC